MLRLSTAVGQPFSQQALELVNKELMLDFL